MPALLWIEMRLFFAIWSSIASRPAGIVRSTQTRAIARAIAAAGERRCASCCGRGCARRGAGTCHAGVPPRRRRPDALEQHALVEVVDLVDVASPRGGRGSPSRRSCRTPACSVAQQREHLLGVLGVEVARRLVGHDELGVADHRPRDGDALLLAARELPRRVVARARRGRPRGSAVAARSRRSAFGERASGAAAARRSPARESTGIRLKNWKTKPTWRARKAASSSSERSFRRSPGDHHVAAARPVEAGEDVEQRRLAGARGAHQRRRSGGPTGAG